MSGTRRLPDAKRNLINAALSFIVPPIIALVRAFVMVLVDRFKDDLVKTTTQAVMAMIFGNKVGQDQPAAPARGSGPPLYSDHYGNGPVLYMSVLT